MLRLLVVADDFTGALDAGVQFAGLGAGTLVVTNPEYEFRNDDEVLVFDSETRHTSPQEACKTVYDFVKRASAFGVQYVYKKTDSGLRGNIGSELAGAMDALGLDAMPFVPAFPSMNRITRNHIHYVNGVPVSQSMFGSDPFEPVRISDVDELIASQTSKSGIRVYDAQTDEDLTSIASELGGDGLRLSGGCAGFAGALARELGFHGGGVIRIPDMPSQFFMICGSVNPVTRNQVSFARDKGFKYICLSTEQKLNPKWPESDECREVASQWLKDIKTNHAILDANNPSEEKLTAKYIKSQGLNINQVRLRISRSVAGAGRALLDEGLDARLMCVGGDTLLALMQSVGVHELVPVCELSKGVVLTSFRYREREIYIMTKSGGFGDDELIVRLAENINLRR